MNKIDKELIISIYDGCYNYAAFIKGVELTRDEQLHICMMFEHEKSTAMQNILNKYNVSRAVVCCEGGIKIIEKDKKGRYDVIYESTAI